MSDVAIEGLLPCPHCGGRPTVSTRTDDERNAYCAHVTIECSQCGSELTRSGDTTKGGYADNRRAQSDAIAAWNARAELATGSVA